MDSTVSCDVTKRDSPALSQTSWGQWGKRVARYRVLWRRRQPKLLQGGGCVSWKERVYQSCAEKSWVQHFVIWSVKTEAWEGGASWMMQEWTSFRKYYWISIWANVGNGWTENMPSIPVLYTVPPANRPLWGRNAWRSPKNFCTGAYLSSQEYEFRPPVVYYEIFGHPTSAAGIRHTFPLNSNIPTVTQFVWVPCVKNSRNGSRSEHLANRYLIKLQIYNYYDN